MAKLMTFLGTLAAATMHIVFGMPQTPKPNIVFFMADDTGWHNVGWHNPDMLTPNADQLVKDGIELDRHYAFVYCSPSRSSFMTGRLPYHAQQYNRNNCDLGQGAPVNMTFISTKLKSAGYHTAHFGKSHLGMARQSQSPRGRGFDESLIYFEGAEDHFSQRSCQDPECLVPIPINTSSPFDFWQNDGPAKTVAGKRYNGYLFMEAAVEFIDGHDPASGPLFLYMAPADSHSPLQAPQEYLDLYPKDWYLDRRQYAAMCSFWDSSIGNITAALKAKNIWDETLFVFSSDNGGPAYWSVEPNFQHGAGANNWPLKGSKISAWEGGIRVAAFVSGGLIPSKMRGTRLQQKIIISDWYGTFCAMAGVEVTDTLAAEAGLPPVDSVSADAHQYLDRAPSECEAACAMLLSIPGQTDKINTLYISNGGYRWLRVPRSIYGRYFPVSTKQNRMTLFRSLWITVVEQEHLQGPDFPNASSAPYGRITDLKLREFCDPCLFDVFADPGEHNNLAEQMPEQVAKMQAELSKLRLTAYSEPSNIQTALCQAQVRANGNFYGPFINGSGPAPNPPGPPLSCKAALLKDGCLVGKPLLCIACAERNFGSLRKAGCQKGDVKLLCSNTSTVSLRALP